MSHEELRDLLHRVVPEAPEPVPAPLVAAGRRSRTRRRVGVVVAAAVAAAAVSTTAGVLGGSEPAPRPDTVASPTPDAVPTPAPTTTEPYDANVCETPARSEPTRSVDLADVVAVTWCGTSTDGSTPLGPLTPEAFVDDPRLFVDALPRMTYQECALLSFQPSGAIVFEHANGTTQTVAQACEPIDIGGVRTLTYGLSTALVDALDQQRDRLQYATEAPTPRCRPGNAGVSGPVRPDRETLVAAVACGAGRLDRSELAALQQAWVETEPLSEQRAATCYYGAAEIRDVGFAVTDRGDPVTIVRTECGLVVGATQVGPVLLDVGPEDVGMR